MTQAIIIDFEKGARGIVKVEISVAMYFDTMMKRDALRPERAGAVQCTVKEEKTPGTRFISYTQHDAHGWHTHVEDSARGANLHSNARDPKSPREMNGKQAGMAAVPPRTAGVWCGWLVLWRFLPFFL